MVLSCSLKISLSPTMIRLWAWWMAFLTSPTISIWYLPILLRCPHDLLVAYQFKDDADLPAPTNEHAHLPAPSAEHSHEHDLHRPHHHAQPGPAGAGGVVGGDPFSPS